MSPAQHLGQATAKASLSQFQTQLESQIYGLLVLQQTGLQKLLLILLHQLYANNLAGQNGDMVTSIP